MSGLPSTLDQLEAELLRDARQELELDQAHVDNLWQSVATASTLGAAISGVGWAAPKPVAPDPSAASSAPATSSGALGAAGKASFGLRALTVAALGGALVGFAAGYGSAGYAAKAPDPPHATTMVSSTTSQVAKTAAFSPDAASQLADEPPAPRAAPDSSLKPRAPSSSKQSSEPAKPSFYEELQYLKRAQSALRQGNGALALGLMKELDSVQPGGALLSERGVTQVLAHCLLGDVKSAERVARRLAAQGLASVYTERLENSCAGAVLSKP